MSRTSVIRHNSRTALVIIRDDYLVHCDFNECAAALLNEFEYRANARYDELDAAGAWAKPGTEAAAPDDWFFWSQDTMQHDLFYHYGERQIAVALKLLTDKGFIERRNGVRGDLDHAYQYRLNVELLNHLLDEPREESYDVAIMRNRSADLRKRSAKMRNIKDLNTEKEKKKDKDGAPKAARQRDLIYDAISSTWNISGGALIGQIKSVLTGTAKKGAWAAAKFDRPVTDPDEIVQFGRWYTRKYPRISLPNSPALVQEHFYAFRADTNKRLSSKVTVLDPDYLRSLQQTSLEDRARAVREVASAGAVH